MEQLFNQKQHISKSDYGRTGKNGWLSPSNIALVKYWGKKGLQQPMNPSLSFSLDKAYTETTLHWEISEHPEIKVLFNGEENTGFLPKTEQLKKRALPYLPFLEHLSMHIETRNSFPHSAGIASSASAMSALALCLMQTEIQLCGCHKPMDKFLREASFIARLGSGSASRSLFPKFAFWGRHDWFPESSDDFAVPLHEVHQQFHNLKDAIIITDEAPKSTSSTEGHARMDAHPYKQNRFEQVEGHVQKLATALKTGDWKAFAEVVEAEALSLHALMLSSEPGFFLFNAQSLILIELIRAFRTEEGIPLSFTLDAGPNLHVLYPADYTERVEHFIHNQLSAYAHKIIYDQAGNGPEITAYDNLKT